MGQGENDVLKLRAEANLDRWMAVLRDAPPDDIQAAYEAAVRIADNASGPPQLVGIAAVIALIENDLRGLE